MQESIIESSVYDMEKCCKESCLHSFSRLYDRYAPAFLGIICRVTGSPHTAEDVLQGSFLQIWTNRQHYDVSKETVFIWMNKIVLKSAILSLQSKTSKNAVEIQSIKNLVYQGNLESA